METKKEGKIPWHIIAPIIAILSLSFAVFSYLSNKRISEITLQQLSISSVVEISEKIPELKILYKEQDLIDSEQEIIIYELRIENTGTNNVRHVDYADDSDWGIEIYNCTLLSNAIIKSASSTYVSDKFKNLQIDSLGRILFPKSLFDSQEYFDIRLLTIKKKTVKPNIKLFGKISGIKAWKYIFYNEITQGSGKTPKLLRNPILNGITLFLSSLWVLLLLFLIIPILWRKLWRRIGREFFKNEIKGFRKHKEFKDNKHHKYVYEMYKNHGESFLHMARDLLTNPENELLKDLVFINELEKEKIEKFKNSLVTNIDVANGNKLENYIESFPRNNDLLKVLEKHGFIKYEEVDDDEMPFTVRMNSQLVDALKEFLEYLNYQR